MKFSKQDITNFVKILATCSVGGIESIIIEDGVVRGVNEARTFVIISSEDVPNIPQKMGVSKLGDLKQRLDLFSSLDPVVEVKESDRGEISAIEISAGRSKASYRCTSTALIKAPKSINDQVAYKVTITPDELKLVLGALRMSACETVKLIIGSDKLATIKLDDTNSFSIDLEHEVESVDRDLAANTFYYLPDILQSVLKTQSLSEIDLLVGEAGTIRTFINGHETVIMPRVGD